MPHSPCLDCDQLEGLIWQSLLWLWEWPVRTVCPDLITVIVCWSDDILHLGDTWSLCEYSCQMSGQVKQIDKYMWKLRPAWLNQNRLTLRCQSIMWDPEKKSFHWWQNENIEWPKIGGTDSKEIGPWGEPLFPIMLYLSLHQKSVRISAWCLWDERYLGANGDALKCLRSMDQSEISLCAPESGIICGSRLAAAMFLGLADKWNVFPGRMENTNLWTRICLKFNLSKSPLGEVTGSPSLVLVLNTTRI